MGKTTIPNILDYISSSFARKEHPDVAAYERVEAWRPYARSFIFDHEATVHLAHFIRDCGDLIIHNRQFAIPPYPTTFIQCDCDALVTNIGRATSGDKRFPNQPLDKYVGYLIHNDTVYVLAAGDEFDNSSFVSIGAWKYELNTPGGTGTLYKQRSIAPNDRDDEWARAALLMGTTYDFLPDEDTRLEIIRSVRILPAYPELMNDLKRKQQIDLLYAGMGDWRNMITMLLMLNQTQRVSVEYVPWRAGIHKGRRKVFLAHTRVNINIAPNEKIRKVLMPGLNPLPRRRHDVRGHFAHYHLIENCLHVWPMIPEVDDNGVPHWQCQNCKGFRVWRKAHERGTNLEGLVVKDYNVIHKDDTP